MANSFGLPLSVTPRSGFSWLSFPEENKTIGVAGLSAFAEKDINQLGKVSVTFKNHYVSPAG
jgi:hypothetical protein